MTLDECYDVARRVSHGLPPSDFGSTRAIKAFGETLRAELVKEIEACARLASGSDLSADCDDRGVTESLRDFTKAALKRRFKNLDEFLQRWRIAERKQAIIEEIEAGGLPLDAIRDELGRDLDPFDLILHIAFDRKPLTRRERAENVKKRDAFAKYGEQARAVLVALLVKYADEGVLNLDDTSVLRIAPFSAMGTPVQLIKAFGDRSDFENAVRELQSALYEETA